MSCNVAKLLEALADCPPDMRVTIEFKMPGVFDHRPLTKGEEINETSYTTP